ncbi:hypothetical protein MPSEU_000767900 [Mayamaea pseudoterrestris]|nr:hypothetical protein MPSEU_000767900 [Mayamaea pseudoterrestris]
MTRVAACRWTASTLSMLLLELLLLSRFANTAANESISRSHQLQQHAPDNFDYFDTTAADESFSHDDSRFSAPFTLGSSRFLANSEDSLQADYSVLGVLVMTLGLIIVVEVIRHYLDLKAKGRPFFQAVLHGVYTELSTLGMVELVVWLLHSYYDNLNVAKEQVFAKVHFCLFYTALLNAFQSILLAATSLQIARKLWVQTERLELNHYVELREEFDRVHAQLGLHKRRNRRKESSHSDGSNGNNVIESATERPQYTTLSLASYVCSVLHLQIRNRFQSKHHDQQHHRPHHHHQYPLLHRKYRRLLVQVRFHELRVQFLQAYKLPLSLKISNYLWRSQLYVLIGLVHVNSTAWLLLTMLANVLFVGVGLLLYETQDADLIGTVMVCIFMASLTGFVLLALVMHRKMESVFDSIMTEKELWETTGAAENAETTTSKADMGTILNNGLVNKTQQDSSKAALDETTQPQAQRATQQLELFWFSDPTVVIALVQFMQFGYALALSIVIIVADVIGEGRIGVHWYLIVIAVSYAIFVLVVARIIPRYTLCTSLGQLVDSKRLHETVAEFHLEEAKLKQKEESELRKFCDRVVQVDRSQGVTTEGTATTASGTTSSMTGLDMAVDTASSALSTAVVGTTPLVKNRPHSYMEESHTRVKQDAAELMAHLVKLDTASLRTNLPETEQHELFKRDDRRRRRKAVSEGVGAMARMKVVSEGVGAMARLGKLNTHRHIASTEIISSTRDDSVLNGKRSTFYSAAASDLEADGNVRHYAEQSSRRRNRKSVSDGVAFMAKLQESFGNDEIMPAPPTRAELREMGRSMSLRPAPNPFGEHRPLRHDVQAQRGSILPTISKTSTIPSNEQLDTAETPRYPAMLQVDDHAPAFWPDAASTTNPSSITGSHAPTERNLSAHNSVAQIDAINCDSHDDDNLSTRSDGAQSDANDIPSINPGHPTSIALPAVRLLWWQVLRAYFLSKRFVVISNVFGTLAAFFFVGERIASFLYSEGISDPTETVSFHFNNTVNFWMLFILLCLFLVTDFLTLYSLGTCGQLQTNKERALCVSALFDILLSSACLVLFTVSEVQRCCIDDDYNATSLNASSQSEYSSTAGTPIDYSQNRLLAGASSTIEVPEPPTCSCTAFGSRLYGGLGSIEPWVSIVGLRIVRFWVAKRIVLALESTFSPASDAAESRQRHGMNLDSLAVTKNHDDLPMVGEKGSIAELWETAVSRYPHIVAKYGEFSGELLQAMLGVAPASSSFNNDEPELTSGRANGFPISAAYEINQKYKDLSTRAQEIIMSGALGKAMKAVPPLPRQSAFGTQAIIHEGVVSDQNCVDESTFFEATTPFDVSFEYDGRFVCPEACLVRSMRRCDRKLLPMLDTWITVDVVMTHFEIVYFDTDGVDNASLNIEAEDIKEALIATSGGKGIRLCDVAAGRRVVGQLALSDIESIHVDRVMPHLQYEASIDEPIKHVHQDEFWIVEKNDNVAHKLDFTSSAWSSIKQDILVIHSCDGGILYLRFYSDLRDAKDHPERWMKENEASGHLHKDNAFQWAQCLGRYCGRNQLKQDLPHFGDDSDDELRDYLIVRHDDVSSARHRNGSRHESLRRIKSFHHSRRRVEMPSQLLDIQRTVHSVEDAPLSPTEKRKTLTGDRRSISMDDSMTHSHKFSIKRMLSRSSGGVVKNQSSNVLSGLAIDEDDDFFRGSGSDLEQ